MDLSAGYDYSCYESGAYVKRWSTDYELVMSNFLGEDADMMPSLMTYLQGHLLAIIAPILLFGIIAVLSCTCWSCGMLACCAGGNGKPRKCCGKCCANPPKWTEGPMEWILMGVTLFLGVVVVGLAIKGLAVNKVQNDAVVKLGGSITLLEGWMTTSQSAVQNMTVNFDLVQKEVTEMKPTFDKWNVNTGQGLQLIEVYDEAPIFGEKGEDRIFGKFSEGNGLGNGHLYTDPNDSTNTLEKFTSYSHGAIRTFLQKRDISTPTPGPSADLGARTDEVFDVCYVITKSRMIYTDMAKGVVSAREQTDKIETNIASLGDSIDSMGGMTESLEPINSTRNLALKSIWILLVSLMILELCIAFFRQLAPQMTSHCFARFLFGFVTSTSPGVSKAFEDDATAMKSQMASLRVPFYALVESITGQKDGVTDVDVPKQGMQDGLFKI